MGVPTPSFLIKIVMSGIEIILLFMLAIACVIFIERIVAGILLLAMFILGTVIAIIGAVGYILIEFVKYTSNMRKSNYNEDR